MATAIITGASSGIGEATAIKLKNQGYNVVGTYFSSLDNANVLKEKFGIDFLRCDVSNEKDVDYLFEYAKKRYGKISVVINCAGIAINQKTLLDVSCQEIEKVLAVNLKGAIFVNKKAVSSMLGIGGKIINVSSVFGIEGGSCEAVYSSSKGGVISLTRALAEELSESTVSVCSVAFGLVDTPMNSHLTIEDKINFASEYGLKSVPTASDAGDELLKILNLNDLNGKTFRVFC